MAALSRRPRDSVQPGHLVAGGGARVVGEPLDAPPPGRPSRRPLPRGRRGSGCAAGPPGARDTPRAGGTGRRAGTGARAPRRSACWTLDHATTEGRRRAVAAAWRVAVPVQRPAPSRPSARASCATASPASHAAIERCMCAVSLPSRRLQVAPEALQGVVGVLVAERVALARDEGPRACGVATPAHAVARGAACIARRKSTRATCGRKGGADARACRAVVDDGARVTSAPVAGIVGTATSGSARPRACR